jgi:hypothetical protein
VNAKLWGCVIMGVLVMHISVLFILDHFRHARNPQPVAVPIEPDFTGTTTTFTNDRGEKVKVVHEFTVNTQLATPDVLEKLPPPPSDTAAQPAKIPAPDAPR